MSLLTLQQLVLLLILLQILNDFNYYFNCKNLPGLGHLDQVYVKRSSEAHISIIFQTVHRVKIKLPGHHEKDIELTKRKDVHASFTINTAATTTITTTNNATLTLFLLLLLPPQPQ